MEVPGGEQHAHIASGVLIRELVVFGRWGLSSTTSESNVRNEELYECFIIPSICYKPRKMVTAMK